MSVPTPWSAGTQAFGPTCHDSCTWDKREIASNQLSEAPRFGLNLGATDDQRDHSGLAVRIRV